MALLLGTGGLLLRGPLGGLARDLDCCCDADDEGTHEVNCCPRLIGDYIRMTISDATGTFMNATNPISFFYDESISGSEPRWAGTMCGIDPGYGIPSNCGVLNFFCQTDIFGNYFWTISQGDFTAVLESTVCEPKLIVVFSVTGTGAPTDWFSGTATFTFEEQ